MSDLRWEKLWSLFHQLSALPGQQRQQQLEQLQQDDPDMAAELRDLLAAHDQDSPLDQRPERLFGLALDLEGRMVGPYRLGRELGRGGMGAVYLGERADGAYQQTVAVKFVARHRDGDARSRFLQERDVLARLEHPLISRLIDGGETDDGIPFLVMEWVDGVPVDEFCRALSLDQRLRLFQKICQAVHYAHQNLVVHRDLKPGNVLVTSRGEPKLLDFGIAKSLDQDHGITLTGMQMTPDYASPEQVSGKPVTTASDVYALGVMLCQVLTGRRPFDFEQSSLARIVEQICHDEPPLISSLAGDRRLGDQLAGDLDAVVVKAMQKAPTQRYPSAQALSDDIGRFLNSEPIVARAPGRWYRVSKFARRHRTGVAVSTLAAVSLLTLSGFLYFQGQQLEAALVESERQTERSRAAFDFLSDLLLEADPEQNQGQPLTVAQVLDQGAQGIAERFADEPTLRTELAQTVGMIYMHLGDNDSAEVFFEQALETAAGADRAASLSGLALVADVREEDQRAEAFQREAIALLEESGDLVARAKAQMKLAAILQSQSRLAEAQQVLEQALAVPAVDAASAASARIRLGALRWGQGHIEDAAGQYELALDTFVSEFGERHHQTARAHYALASAYHALGQYELGQDHIRTALSIQQELYGQRHPHVAQALDLKGALHYDSGDSRSALDTALQSLGIKREIYSEPGPLVRTYNNLALAEHDLGLFDRAEQHYRQALDINVNLRGENHQLVASNRSNLGLLMMDQSRPGDALDMLEAAHRVHQSLYRPDHPSAGFSFHLLGRAYYMQGRLDLARQHLDAAVEIRRKMRNGRHPQLADSLLWLSRLLRAQGDTAGAAAAAQQAYGIRRESLNDGDWRLAEARAESGAWLLVGGDAEGQDRIQAGRRQMVEIRGPEDWRTLRLDQQLQEILCPSDPCAMSLQSVEATQI
ncbi:MAG: serine/threonine-protein kinase [Xanthomonadales bacterium]|nr:serine/threonine-protein kinase [Xanthomonadales bacterium]